MGILSNRIDKEKLKPGDHIYTWRTAYIYAHHGIYVGDGMVIHFTRGAGQETGIGTVLDRILACCSPSNLDRICEACGDQSNLHGVIISCLDCFLAGDKLYSFAYEVSPAFFLAKARGGTCTFASSDPADVVLHRSRYLLEHGFGVYNIFQNNCEDFAIYCKTGLLVITTARTTASVGHSGQLSSLATVASSIVTSFSFLTASSGSVGHSGQLSSLATAASSIASSLRFLTTGSGGLLLVTGGTYCVKRYVSDIGVRRDVRKISVEMLVAVVAESDMQEPEEATVSHN